MPGKSHVAGKMEDKEVILAYVFLGSKDSGSHESSG
jgi:hypothetical protein